MTSQLKPVNRLLAVFSLVALPMLAASTALAESGYREIESVKIQANGLVAIKAVGEHWHNEPSCNNASFVYIEPDMPTFDLVYRALLAAFESGSEVEFSFDKQCLFTLNNSFPVARAVQIRRLNDARSPREKK